MVVAVRDFINTWVILVSLKGSIKSSHNSFLTLPVSAEDLHMSKSSRNFWVRKDDIHLWSATGVSKNKGIYDEHVSMQGGFLWHQITRVNNTLELKAELDKFCLVEPCGVAPAVGVAIAIGLCRFYAAINAQVQPGVLFGSCW